MLGTALTSAQLVDNKGAGSATGLGGSVDTGSSRRIEGSIVMSGAVAMVKIELSTASMTYHQRQFTDSGRFVFAGVPSGTYNITLSAEGYETINETIDVRGTTNVLYVMRPKGVEKTTIGGTRPVSAAALKVPANARKEYDAGVHDLEKHHRKQARGHFEKALAFYPGFAEALHRLALFDIAEGKEQQAFDKLQNAVKADPSFADGYVALAYVCNVLQRDREASDAADHAITLAPKAWAPYFEYGKASLALNEVQKADEAASRMKSLYPSLPETHLLLAGVLLKRMSYPQARDELTQFLALAPQHRYAELAKQTLKNIENKE